MPGYEYGIIGNGRISALVSLDASIDWCCMPRFDEPSIFAKVLDEDKGGSFSVSPCEPERYTITQHYIKNTNVLRTVFSSPEDEFEVIDYVPCYDKMDYFFKPIQIHRLVRVLRGYPSARVGFDPRFNYAQNHTSIRNLSNAIRATDEVTGDEVFLYTNVPLDYVSKRRDFLIPNNSYFVLTYERPMETFNEFTVQRDFHLTSRYWQRWVQGCNVPHRYQQQVIRSALVLKLLMYEETGAIIAAATTSLPEIAGEERNWDYRFCWLRDAFFAISALTRLCRIPEAQKFIQYVQSTLTGHLEYIRPIYTIDGGIVPEEESIDLRGYADSRPVRIGNSATAHYQDDVYGEIILSIYPLFFDERFLHDELEELWELVIKIVDLSIKRFAERDQGIWEFRGESKHYTFSKLMIWAAVDRGAKIAHKMQEPDYADQWTQEANRMREEILRRSWNEDVGSFTQAYGDEHLDASNLLIPVVGLLDGDDPRIKRTIEATKRHLTKDGFVFRYVNEDDFGQPKTAFLICSFWLVDALTISGHTDEAREYFEKLLSYCNHLGLLSEDVDPRNRRLLGNFPQAYSHVAIINSALLLEAHEISAHRRTV